MDAVPGVPALAPVAFVIVLATIWPSISLTSAAVAGRADPALTSHVQLPTLR